MSFADWFMCLTGVVGAAFAVYGVSQIGQGAERARARDRREDRRAVPTEPAGATRR